MSDDRSFMNGPGFLKPVPGAHVYLSPLTRVRSGVVVPHRPVMQSTRTRGFNGSVRPAGKPMHFLLLATLGILFLSVFSLPGSESIATGESSGGGVGTVALAKGIALSLPLWLLLVATDRYVVRNLIALSPILLLATYGLLTSLWSPEFTYSAIRAGTLLVFCLSLSVLLAAYRSVYPGHSLSAVLDHLATITGVVVIAFFIAGVAGIEEAWRAVFQDTGEEVQRLGGSILPPNSLGFLAGTHMLLALGSLRYLNRPVFAVTTLMASAYVLLYSDSRSAIVSILLALALLSIFWAFLVKAGRSVVVPGVALVASAFLLLSLYISLGFLGGDTNTLLEGFSRGGSTGELYSLNGRTELWSNLLQVENNRRLFFGSGYGVLTASGSASVSTMDTLYAHNGYLQLLAGVGILGTALFFVYLIQALSRLQNSFLASDGNTRTEWLLFRYSAVIFFVLANSLTEASFGSHIQPQTIVFFLLTLAMISATDGHQRPQGWRK